MQNTESVTQRLNTVQIGALVVGVVGVVLSIVGALADTSHFFQIYLVAFLFWVQISIGSLALLMIHNMVGGKWGLAAQRVLAAGARTLPLMLLLFIPVVVGMNAIYPWVNPTADVNAFNTAWLNTPFFLIRAAIFFAVWIGLAYLLTSWSYRNDTENDPKLVTRIQRLSVGGMILLMLTTTFAAWDWNMSLLPSWFSSSFGWLAFSREVLFGFAIAILGLSLVWDSEPLKDLTSGKRALPDLATLLLVSVLVWSYLTFFQYIVMWSANLAPKVVWYDVRSFGTWLPIVITLAAGHGLVILLMVLPNLKKNRAVMVGLALFVLVLRFVELFWMVMPTYLDAFSVQWVDIVALLGVGGLWVAFFAWTLKQHSLVPLNYPIQEGSYEPSTTK